jgi:PIN domain nuclease of toxin-antitoxin system
VLGLPPEAAWVDGQLPLHHRDPLDRALIAHAQQIGFTVVTVDAAFAGYDVDLLDLS